MTETVKENIFSILDSPLIPQNSISLFTGKLGISFAYIYYGSTHNLEVTYDKGLMILAEVLKSVEHPNYINLDREIPLIGYVISHLNRHNYVSFDMTDVLASADEFMFNKIVNTNVQSIDVYQTLINAYYVSSRLLDEGITDSRFNIDLLNLILLDFLAYIDTISKGKKASSIDNMENVQYLAATTINILNLLRFLERNSLQTGLSSEIKNNLLNIKFSADQVERFDIYHKFLFYNYLSHENLDFKDDVIKFPFDLISKLHDKNGGLSVSQAMTICHLMKFDPIDDNKIHSPSNNTILKDLIGYFGINERHSYDDLRKLDVGLINGVTSLLVLEMDQIDLAFWEIVILMPLYNEYSPFSELKK